MDILEKILKNKVKLNFGIDNNKLVSISYYAGKPIFSIKEFEEISKISRDVYENYLNEKAIFQHIRQIHNDRTQTL